MGDLICRQAAIDVVMKCYFNDDLFEAYEYELNELPSAQLKRGRWILNRSGAYCCSECMEPCAGYVMMQPRDRFCKMCGAKMEEE